MEPKQTPLTRERPEEFIRIDLRKLGQKMLSYWWLFILCFGLSLGAAHLYLRYATFEYSARAILLIKDAGRSGNISTQDILLADGALSGGKAMDNEIQILKSLTLMEKVVERLGLNISYFRLGNVKDTELYQASPFLVDSFALARQQEFGVSFLLEQGDYTSFLLKRNEEDPGIRYYYGVPFENEVGRFTISLNPLVAVLKGEYRLLIRPVFVSASRYKSNLNVERIGDQFASSVLQLSIMDPVPQKASDIINTLIDIYNQEEIKDENKVLENTLVFIDNRVADLVSELDSVEGGIQQFKSSNEIINEDASSSMNYTLGEIRSAVQQISSFEIQKNLLQSLENFLQQDDFENELIPANLVAESPSLAGLVTQYNGLVLRNKQIAQTASKKNPSRMVLEDQIGDIRQLILETIRNQRIDIQIPVKELEDNIRQLRRSMQSIPGIEKQLIEKMRTQGVKENLFLYLLQKREETALSEAVTTAKTRMIDHARVPKFPVYPQPKLIRAASGVLGLFIPALIVLLLASLETKVDTEDTIKQFTNIPILGRIPKRKGEENIVVKYGSRSAINEMFRLLRTNLNFISHNKDHQIIVLTSSVSGEGKTFIALNLGLTLALADKKVILLGLDLRKPKLAAYIKATKDKGVTNYLVQQSELNDIIQCYADNPNLHFITSGPTPPNPAELILSDRMKSLLLSLKERYDYVLIDTPPIGLVSDALLLREDIDNFLIVVRQKYTRKVMLRNLEQMYQNKELPGASIIFNGVKQGGRYYGYGGYYYGKNQGYYVEES